MADFSDLNPSWDSTSIDFSAGVILPPYAVASIQVEMYEVARGTVQLQWLPTPFNTPITYDIYCNGVAVLTTQQLIAQIEGLAAETDYVFYVVGDTQSPLPDLPAQSRRFSYRYGLRQVEYDYPTIEPAYPVE